MDIKSDSAFLMILFGFKGKLKMETVLSQAVGTGVGLVEKYMIAFLPHQLVITGLEILGCCEIDHYDVKIDVLNGNRGCYSVKEGFQFIQKRIHNLDPEQSF